MRSKEGAAFRAVPWGQRAGALEPGGADPRGRAGHRRNDEKVLDGEAGPEIFAMCDGALPFSDFHGATSEAASRAMLDAMRA